jgi:hypothetical protein
LPGEFLSELTRLVNRRTGSEVLQLETCPRSISPSVAGPFKAEARLAHSTASCFDFSWIIPALTIIDALAAGGPTSGSKTRKKKIGDSTSVERVYPRALT